MWAKCPVCGQSAVKRFDVAVFGFRRIVCRSCKSNLEWAPVWSKVHGWLLPSTCVFAAIVGALDVTSLEFVATFSVVMFLLVGSAWAPLRKAR